MQAVDPRGRPRCPTCFRRLHRMRVFDAYMCPSRSCPHHDAAEQFPVPGLIRRAYMVTGLVLARAAR